MSCKTVAHARKKKSAEKKANALRKRHKHVSVRKAGKGNKKYAVVVCSK